MRCAALALILISWPVVGQDTKEKNQAEKLFWKLEERLSKAETIQCKYQAVFEVKEVKPGERAPFAKVEGLLLLQQGNKLRLLIDGRVALQNPGKVEVISDGTTVATVAHPQGMGKKEGAKEKAPANLQSSFRATLSRQGILMFLINHMSGGSLAERLGDEIENGKKEAPSEFKLRGKEKVGENETQVIEFRVAVGEIKREEKGDCYVTLWLDAKTGLPVKRLLTLKGDGKVVGTLTETYAGFKLDDEIGPGEFQLEKKEFGGGGWHW